MNWSWSLSVANLATSAVASALQAHAAAQAAAEPRPAYIAPLIAKQQTIAIAKAVELVDELMSGDAKPVPRAPTTDEKAAAEAAKKAGKDAAPPPEVRASVSLTGHVPSGQPGDRASMTISVSIG